MEYHNSRFITDSKTQEGINIIPYEDLIPIITYCITGFDRNIKSGLSHVKTKNITISSMTDVQDDMQSINYMLSVYDADLLAKSIFTALQDENFYKQAWEYFGSSGSHSFKDKMEHIIDGTLEWLDTRVYNESGDNKMRDNKITEFLKMSPIARKRYIREQMMARALLYYAGNAYEALTEDQITGVTYISNTLSYILQEVIKRAEERKISEVECIKDFILNISRNIWKQCTDSSDNE